MGGLRPPGPSKLGPYIHRPLRRTAPRLPLGNPCPSWLCLTVRKRTHARAATSGVRECKSCDRGFPMKLAVPKERRANEARVAATPDTVKRLKGLGLDIVVETGAGTGTSIPDQAFVDAGATIAPD